MQLVAQIEILNAKLSMSAFGAMHTLGGGAVSEASGRAGRPACMQCLQAVGRALCTCTPGGAASGLACVPRTACPHLCCPLWVAPLSPPPALPAGRPGEDPG